MAYFDQLAKEVQKTSTATSVFVDAIYQKLASKDIQNGKLLPSTTSAEKLKETYGEALLGNSVWSMLEERVKNPPTQPQVTSKAAVVNKEKEKIEMMDDRNAIKRILVQYNKFPHPEKLDQVCDEREIQGYLANLEKIEDNLGVEAKPICKKCSTEMKKKIVSLVSEVFSLYGTGKVGEAYALWEAKKAKEQQKLKETTIPIPKSHTLKPTVLSSSPEATQQPLIIKPPEWNVDLMMMKIKEVRPTGLFVVQDGFVDMARFWRKTGLWLNVDNSGHRVFKNVASFREMTSLIAEFMKRVPPSHLEYIAKRKLPGDTDPKEFKLNSERIQAYLSGLDEFAKTQIK